MHRIPKPLHHVNLARLLKRDRVEEEIAMLLADGVDSGVDLGGAQGIKGVGTMRGPVGESAIGSGLGAVRAIRAIRAIRSHVK